MYSCRTEAALTKRIRNPSRAVPLLQGHSSAFPYYRPASRGAARMEGAQVTAIPTEPIGSIPRPLKLIEALEHRSAEDPELDSLYEEAIRDTIACFEASGSPVITDGEQRKYHNFWTYSVHGLPNTAPDGFRIPFAAGHTRRMPRLTSGPFRYKRRADSYLDAVMPYASVPLKQAVISPSALS